MLLVSPFGSGPPITAFASYHFRLSSHAPWLHCNFPCLIIQNDMGTSTSQQFSTVHPAFMRSIPCIGELTRSIPQPKAIFDPGSQPPPFPSAFLRFTCAFRRAFPAMAPWNAGCAAKTNSKCVLCVGRKGLSLYRGTVYTHRHIYLSIYLPIYLSIYLSM